MIVKHHHLVKTHRLMASAGYVWIKTPVRAENIPCHNASSTGNGDGLHVGQFSSCAQAEQRKATLNDHWIGHFA
jgi:hypothetical protein